MTNKEAIAVIKTLCHTCESFPKCVNDKPECFKALEMAIDALRNFPTQMSGTSEDTISRQAAIEETWKEPSYTDPINVLTEVRDRIKALPSAQPKINNQINLCDSCSHTYPDCPAGDDDVLFGNGKSGDNICACRKYEVFEQDWIPCSKDMPRQYGNYLVSIEGEEEPDIGTINPSDGRGWSLCDANGFYWAYNKMLNITAWKPLPEPYRGDTECKNGNTK